MTLATISVIERCKRDRGTSGSIRYAPYFRYAWIRSAWGFLPKKLRENVRDFHSSSVIVGFPFLLGPF